MTFDRHWFLAYEKCDGGMVYLGDDSPLSIVGCGRILIMLFDGRGKGISGVLNSLGLA